MRLSLLTIPAMALGAAASLAQAPAPGADPGTARAPLQGPANPRLEFIRHEDTLNRIDEVRYGGETQRVVVTPKSGAPEYEIQTLPLSGVNRTEPREGLGAAGAPRVWNILRF
jgi:hypothetical protein